ncbi:MAG: diguanylate cyclase [Candidatus Melainabacteria bacterium]|nr:diguanylate cyclase [Candidatus Melainabacteria bacterium]
MKQNQNILVVDDDKAHALMLAELLKDAGYGVVSANDGFRALAACKVRTPDLILLDLTMPLMGGIEVLKRLKADERTKSIPIIFLATLGELRAILEFQEGLIQDFLTKPVDPTELSIRVRTALRVKSLKEKLGPPEKHTGELSLTDAVTGLQNQHFLNEFVKAEIAQCCRYSVPLSLIILAIDQEAQLKQVENPKVFDKVIAQLATYLAQATRQCDVLVRINGSEFALVLPHTDREGAIEVAERLRNTIAQSSFSVNDSAFVISISLGICQFAPQMDNEGKILLSHARAALAQGQASGGNITLLAH